MAFQSIQIKNFRGIGEETHVPLKPITIFIGANSSGKSTVLHALAALSQTSKLANDNRPLVLDDEQASVHLGRFIEVIHSKNYSDSINLGLAAGAVPVLTFDRDEKGAPTQKAAMETVEFCFSFKSTTRTQIVYLDEGMLNVGRDRFKMKHTGPINKGTNNRYEITNLATEDQTQAVLKGGFLFEEMSFFAAGKGWEPFYSFMSAQRGVNVQLQNTHYLGPFRLSPQRQYPTRGASPIEVGPQGENTATLLANETLRTQQRNHINEIARWLEVLGLGKNLNVSRIATSDMFDLSVTLKDGDSFPIADLGYGLSQVLPVLTQCSFAEKDATLLFEQPELHLHALAVKPLAKVFIDVMQKKNVSIIAETHSVDFVGQFIRELRAGSLKIDEILLYRVHRENHCTIITPIDIEPGTFDVYQRWEAGISVPELS